MITTQRFLALGGLCTLVVIAVTILLPESSSGADTSASQIEPNTTLDEPAFLAKSNEEGKKELLAISAAEKKTANKPNYYLASKQCHAQASDFFKKYPLNANALRRFHALGAEKFRTEDEAMRTYSQAAASQIFSGPKISSVLDAVDLNSIDYKRADIDLATYAREHTTEVDGASVLSAIEKGYFQEAEGILRQLIEQYPNTLLSLKGAQTSLFQLALISRVGQSKQSTDSVKNVIDTFVNAGYRIHFPELLELSNLHFRNQLEVVEHLASNFNGDLNTVYNRSFNLSSNLLIDAMTSGNVELAAFWLKKDVDPFSNFSAIKTMAYSISFPEFNKNEPETQAILALLDAGLLTISTNQIIEENLNAWLPSGNSAHYFERHARLSNLPKDQDEQLRNDFFSILSTFTTEHSNGEYELGEDCVDEFLAFIRRVVNRIRNRSQAETQAKKEEYEQLHKQAMDIYGEFSDGLIDADLAIDQLSLIDEHRAKNTLGHILDQKLSKTWGNLSLKPKINVDEQDEAILKRIQVAVNANDISLALKLAESLNPAIQPRLYKSFLDYALDTKQSSEVFRVLFSEIEDSATTIISFFRRTEDMQLLETIASAGFDINAQDMFTDNLLTMSIKAKHKNALNALIRLGVDVEQPSIGNDALDIALSNVLKGHGDFYFVQKLLMANKQIEGSHRQLLLDLLQLYPQPTQRVIDRYGIVM
jgi:hypothetical protein